MTESEGTFELPLVRCCTASLRTSTTASEFLFFSFGNFVGDVRVKFVVHFDESAEMILINLETFLLQVGGSCNAGRDVRLNVRDCLPRFPLLPQVGGGLLVDSGDGFCDRLDLSLHRRPLSLDRDRLHR